jgi:hypothetical protein
MDVSDDYSISDDDSTDSCDLFDSSASSNSTDTDDNSSTIDVDVSDKVLVNSNDVNHELARKKLI